MWEDRKIGVSSSMLVLLAQTLWMSICSTNDSTLNDNNNNDNEASEWHYRQASLYLFRCRGTAGKLQSRLGKMEFEWKFIFICLSLEEKQLWLRHSFPYITMWISKSKVFVNWKWSWNCLWSDTRTLKTHRLNLQNGQWETFNCRHGRHNNMVRHLA